jgi:hypothetical protein
VVFVNEANYSGDGVFRRDFNGNLFTELRVFNGRRNLGNYAAF